MADITGVDQSSLPHNADIYWHYAGDPVQRSQLLGTFNIGAPQKVLLPIPADASIVLRAVPRGARGQTWMGGPGDATPVTVSALGVGTGGGTSNFYQQLRINHGYSYGTTPTPRPVLNLLNAFQIKDDSLYGESDLSTFGVPTGLLNLRTDCNASGQIAVTTLVSFNMSGTVTVAATLELQPGMGILVAGAGISGGNLIGTVGSVSADGKTYVLTAALVTAPTAGALVQADDTVAVQTWINGGSISGAGAAGDLVMPPGYYRLTSSIILPTTSEGFSVIIHGSGWDLSVFAFQHTGDGFVSTSDLKIDSMVFTDLTISTGTYGDASGTINPANRGIGVRMTAPSYTGIYNNFVMQRCRVIGWGRWGLWSDNLEVSWISQCIFRENKSGHVAFVGPDTISPNKQPNANTITDTTFDQAISAGPSDSKRTVTGSMTAGSRTLSGSGFTANDRGKFVIVHGAATIGGDLYSFIDTFNSSSNVTLAHQAQFTVSGTQLEVFPVNVASILLNRANDTVLDGSTIQGNFADAGSGATNVLSDVNAIKVYNSDNCRFIGIHEEDNAGPGGAAIRMENCHAITIENWGGTSAGPPNFDNAHGADFQLLNCHSVRVAQCFFNDRPQFLLDGNCSEIEIDNSLVVGYINLWQQDNSWDKLKIGSGVRIYQAADPRTNQVAGNEYLYDSLFGRNLIINGRFLDGVGGNEGWTTTNPTWWSNPFTALTRYGSYIRVDATAIAASTTAQPIFHQAVPIADSLPNGLFTLGFDWYLEAQNGVETTGYFVEVRLHPSTGIDEVCQFSTRRFSVVTGAWQSNQIRCFLGSGTSRNIDVQINVTPGPNNVKIRFTNFRLAAGKHVFGAYEQAVHDFGGRMRAPLALMPMSAVNYPAPPTAGGNTGVNADTSMISLANIGGILNLGKAGVYTPIATGGSAHVIQEEGAPLPQQPNLNFVGQGITAANDPVPVNARTNITLNAATDTTEGIVSTAVQSFAGTKTFVNGLVAQLPTSATSGTHIQEWRTNSGSAIVASIDTQPILRLGIPNVGGFSGFLELCSDTSTSTLKLAAAVTPTAAQTLRFPAAFPSVGNMLTVTGATGGVVTLGWGGAGAGHTIMEEGGALIQRANLNFIGQGITASDGGVNTEVRLNAATQTTEGIVSTVAQNFGGQKTFFAGAIMQGTGAAPILTVQGQGASGAIQLQEWKDNGGVFSLGYFRLTATPAAVLRIGNPNAYDGQIDLCSQSSSFTTSLKSAVSPAATYVYLMPGNTPTATQVLGVASVAGSTIGLSWQAAGAGGGANIQLSNLDTTGGPPSNNPAVDPNVRINTHLGFSVDGGWNIGAPTHRVGSMYLLGTFFMYPAGSTNPAAPKAFGFLDPAVGEYTRVLLSGNAHICQGGNGQRLQFTSYHSFEFRGNRRNTGLGTPLAFTTISGTDSSSLLVYLDRSAGAPDCIPLLVNTDTTAAAITSDLFHCQNAGVSKFRVGAQGTIIANGGTQLGVKGIQPSGGATYTMTVNDRTLGIDTAIQSVTVFLPLASTCRGQVYDVVALRQIQFINDPGNATGSGNTITLTPQTGDVFNGWLTSPGLSYQMSNTAGRRAIKLIADATNNIWWVLPYNL